MTLGKSIVVKYEEQIDKTINSVVSIESTSDKSGIATVGPNSKLIINGGNHEANGGVLYESTGGKIEISNGEFISMSNACIGTVAAGGEIIINGGNHTTSGLTLYKSTGGKIVINDGSFQSTLTTATAYTLLDGSNHDIVVRGGSFYLWDPSDNDKDFNDPENFLAKPEPNSKEKLIISHVGDWYNVNTEYTVSGNKDQASSDFVGFIENGVENGDVINIENTISVPNLYDFSLENKGSVTINMNNNTLEGDASSGYSGLFLSNTHITINNGNFTGGGLNIQGEGSKATLNNCNITITSVNTSNRHGVYGGYKSEVIFNGGTIQFAPKDNMAKKRSYFCADRGTIYILDCICGPASARTETPPLYLVNSGNIIIYRGTFGFDPELYVTLPEGSTSTKVGNVWTVSSTYITSESGSTTILGGTYTFDPSSWVPIGYSVIQNDNLSWTVQKDPSSEE